MDECFAGKRFCFLMLTVVLKLHVLTLGGDHICYWKQAISSSGLFQFVLFDSVRKGYGWDHA